MIYFIVQILQYYAKIFKYDYLTYILKYWKYQRFFHLKRNSIQTYTFLNKIYFCEIFIERNIYLETLLKCVLTEQIFGKYLYNKSFMETSYFRTFNKSIFIFECYSSNNIHCQCQYLLQMLKIFLILMNKLSIPWTEKFVFLYFINFLLSETFIFKNIYLSVFIGTSDVKVSLEKVLCMSNM